MVDERQFLKQQEESVARQMFVFAAALVLALVLFSFTGCGAKAAGDVGSCEVGPAGLYAYCVEYDVTDAKSFVKVDDAHYDCDSEKLGTWSTSKCPETSVVAKCDTPAKDGTTQIFYLNAPYFDASTAPLVCAGAGLTYEGTK